MSNTDIDPRIHNYWDRRHPTTYCRGKQTQQNYHCRYFLLRKFSPVSYLITYFGVSHLLLQHVCRAMFVLFHKSVLWEFSDQIWRKNYSHQSKNVQESSLVNQWLYNGSLQEFRWHFFIGTRMIQKQLHLWKPTPYQTSNYSWKQHPLRSVKGLQVYRPYFSLFRITYYINSPMEESCESF